VSDNADSGIGREATTESFEHRVGKIERDSFCGLASLRHDREQSSVAAT
jgi:hypothetical protein